MDKKAYNAAAVKFNLWMPETKKVCKLRQDGMTIRQIRQKNNEYDIFDAPSEEYSKTIMSVIAKRLDAGGGSFVPLFLRSDERGQKLLCLITCLLTDPLFYDFTSELIGAKLSCGLFEFDDIFDNTLGCVLGQAVIGNPVTYLLMKISAPPKCKN